MKKSILLGVVIFLCSVNIVLADISVVASKHNLSSSGPGTIKALSESRVCIFCHTPHNGEPLTPLWNRSLTEGVNYTPYDSTTFDNSLVSIPSGSSRLCLSCHDGTIALGAVKSVPGGIAMNHELAGSSALLGVDLSDDHPFSFSYAAAVPFDTQLEPTQPSNLIFENGAVQCVTCHDPHDDTYGMFLVMDNNKSALCITCHNLAGWGSSLHATSTKLVGSGKTVADNGCENCHTPHNAGGPQRLMKYREEEKNCTYTCHNGQVSDPSKNIAAEMVKISTHPVANTTIGVTTAHHDPTENVSFLQGHVECQDCHNPHRVSNNPASAPLVTGALAFVSGISETGSVVNPAAYEYEICFKCHGDSNTDSAAINRYLNNTNVRQEFATSNPSFHPVVGAGKNANVPSLPSTTSLDQTMNFASRIYCSDCHSSDQTTKIGGSGPNGPHGSIYSPILREEYETSVGTPESYASYALCYRCHDRNSILSNASFQTSSAGRGGHSNHLASGTGTPCSVCHDPHGVVDDGVSGDHTNLINFDLNVVSPTAGNSAPLFKDNGLFSGTCTLVCHGVTHDGSATYSYP